MTSRKTDRNNERSARIERASEELLKAAIYLRVSTKEQAEAGGEREGFSIPAQREACKRKADALGAVVVEEFADRGESAKTAQRPALQRMLAYVVENKIDYLIVHKVDRLARNRFDDVTINVALKQAGVTLVSVTENIDATPSGALLHSIMSGVAEFYSRNLAQEVMKGTMQKVRQGGTVTKAPIGYLNVRKLENGREMRTVAIDPERGPMMRWAFEEYATGNWTLRTLLKALTEKGFTAPPSARRAARVMSIGHFNRLLRNPYYKGVVRYNGLEVQGTHEPLIDEELFSKVQELLSENDAKTGTKERIHNHYLKGLLRCGTCGEKLCFTNANGNGGKYAYFFCLGRQSRRQVCSQRALSVEKVEGAIGDHFELIHVDIETRGKLHDWILDQLRKNRLEAEVEAGAQNRRLNRLKNERTKLIEAYLAGALPVEVLKEHQARIALGMQEAKSLIDSVEYAFDAVEQNLEAILDVVTNVGAAYREAPARTRRQLIQAFFEELVIDEEYRVRAEFGTPFGIVLHEGVKKAARGRKPHGYRNLKYERRARFRPDAGPWSGRRWVTYEPVPIFSGNGLSNELLVGEVGLEPTTRLRARILSPLCKPFHHSPDF